MTDRTETPRTPSMPSIPDRRSLRDHGPYSAYCKVCWNPIYALWIDETPHGGVCMHGCSNAADCPDATSRAKAWAEVSAAIDTALSPTTKGHHERRR